MLDDLAAAREDAVRMFGQLLIDDPQGFGAAGEWQLTVTDEARQALFTVRARIADAEPLRIEVVPNPAG